MQIVSKRLGAIVLGACLLVALAFGGFLGFGGVSAFAEASWQGSGNNSLTVEACDSKSEMAKDIPNANVVVDVYFVAKKNSNVNGYTWEEDFKAIETDVSKLDAEGWQTLADNAAREVGKAKQNSKEIEFVPINADGKDKLSNVGDGIYLLLPHGADVEAYGKEDMPELHAYSAINDYSFAPTLVVAPSKDADGSWTNSIPVTLKPERMPLFGSIKIKKSTTSPVGEPRSFVFHLLGDKPDGSKYENYAEVHFENATESNEKIVKHIPAGTKLTVTEEITSGTGYKQVENASDEGKKVEIVADRIVEKNGVETMVSVSFLNEPDGGTNHGYGIENNFTLTKIGDKDSDWDWKLVADSAKYHDEKPSN